MKVTFTLELSEISVALRCKLANELKDERVLSALAEDANTMVRKTVAENPNTLASDLKQLARDESEEVVFAAVKNPNTSTDDLLSFFYYARKIYYPKLYEDSKKVSNDLPVLSKFAAYMVLKSIAQNTKAPKAILAKLSEAGDFDYDIRLDVAENPNTSQSILEELAQDEDEFMRETVARNLNTPKSALKSLVKDKVDEVRKAVAENPNISKSDLLKLINDEDIGVRVVAKERLKAIKT
ncbi:MAG: hypothetical protein IKN65_01015 [Clostridia bacterium]|nr:hypothetical protein [Clostridia bacterium]